jgi:uncharacterized protein
MEIRLTKEQAIAQITHRLIEYYSPVRIYLFGSEARGDAGPDSDLDFCVVVPDNLSPQKLNSSAVYSFVSGTGYAKDIVRLRQSDFEARAAHVVASLPATVVREGKLLYDAGWRYGTFWFPWQRFMG